MLYNKRPSLLLSIFLILVISLTACGAPQPGTQTINMKDYGFVVKGVSGKDVMLDITWYRDCVSGGEGTWTKSMRTMSGRELATTITDYQNESKTPDCTNGFSMINVFVQTLTNDKVLVPITWTDAAGQPATPPAGLEGVKEGNGASGAVTFATLTPLTQAKADGLNFVKFCGITDWAPSVTKDLLACFTTGGSAKGTIVVDDRTKTGAVYDGISINPAEYPTLMPNTPPHKGLLNGIIFGNK